MTDINIDGMTLTRVNCNVYGNPRYVVHYRDLVSDAECEKCKELQPDFTCELEYSVAKARAHKLKGTVYRAKWYGGGFVFTEWSPENLVAEIKQSLKNDMLVG